MLLGEIISNNHGIGRGIKGTNMEAGVLKTHKIVDARLNERMEALKKRARTS